MRTKAFMKQAVVLVLFSMFMFFGCDNLDDGTISAEDSTAAVSKVDAATASLENIMQDVFDADPDSVQEMIDLLDFSEPYALYSEASQLDPGNSDANFGMAFTGFMRLTQDPQLDEMLLRWEAYFKVNEPFLVESYSNNLGRAGYGLPMSIDGIGVPLVPFMEMPMALSKMSLADVPQFSEFQDLVESLFLPIIDESIAALEMVDDDSSYVFMISSSMQGDPESDPLELDLTEIYLLEAGLYSLKGVLKTVVAYNFDFVSFDSIGIVTELNQGSEFATLKSNGTRDLGFALSSVNTAFEKVFAALDFLEAETDDQSNDLIAFSEDDDPAEIRADITEIQSALQGPTLIHYGYWEDIYDNDGYWVDEEYIEDSIKIDISQFFINPITDFKAMLPPYTMGTQVYYESEYHYDYVHVDVSTTSVDVTGLDNTPVSVSLSYDSWNTIPITAFVQIGFLGYDLTTNPSAVPAVIMEAYSAFLALVDQYSSELYEYPYITFYWNGSVTSGQSLSVQGDVYIEYEQIYGAYVEPHPTWNDATYSDWLSHWPDPTMNGIFPDMDAAGIADFFGFYQEDWDQMNN